MKDLTLQTPSNEIVVEIQKEGPQGLSVNWRGAYSATTTYQVNDAVYWNSSSYICTAVTTGNLPSDTDYWDLMSSGMGDFSGPPSSTADNFVSFANGDGKLGKDSGYNGNSFEPKNSNIQNHISSISNPHSVTKNQVGLGNVQNVDQTNPANITQTSSYRFVTDTEKSTWNGKQDAIGYTPENVSNKKTTITSSDTDYPTCKAVETALAGKQPTGSYEVTTNKKTTLTDSDTDYPTTKAVNTGLSGKENTIGYTTENVANKTTSIPTDGSSDTKYPSAKAVKDYADGLVAGLIDYRGSYDASGNTFPATGGSGTGGAIMKGDTWVISVAGTLGGVAIQVGDWIIANTDTPEQTTGNWDKLNTNISYVPEDVANKVTSISSGSTDTQYPTAKLLYDQLALKENLSNKVTSISGSSTDIQYPSAKLLYDQLALKLNISAKATSSDINTGTDDTKYVTPLAIENSYIGLEPTLSSTTNASKGGVFNGGFELVPTGTDATTTNGKWIDGTSGGSDTTDNYGWYFRLLDGTGSAKFDNTVSKRGNYSMKLSTTNTSGRVRAIIRPSSDDSLCTASSAKYLIPIKPSTKYRIGTWIKTNNVAASSAYIEKYEFPINPTDGSIALTQVSSSKATGTTDWTYYEISFTSTPTSYFLHVGCILNIAGNVSDAWFDNVTVQEVQAITTNTNTIPEVSKPILTAVTSTDSIDQSLDTGGAYTNTYAVPTAIDEGATHRQTFTPTKKKVYSYKTWIVSKGTGDWTAVLHDASNNVIGSQKITNASLVEGAFNEFIFAHSVWSSGALHVHVYSSVEDGTAKTNTTNDFEASSFIQTYAKMSEQLGYTLNGIPTILKGDQDGLFGQWDIARGKWRYVATPNSTTDICNNVYQSSFGGWTAIGSNRNVINGFEISPSGLSLGLRSKNDATERYITWKVNTILPIKHLKFVFGNYYTGDVLQVSSDNINWTSLTSKNGSATNTTHQPETDLINGKTQFYIRVYKDTTNTYLWMNILQIEADIDTTSIPRGLIYPLGIYQPPTRPVQCTSAPTRVYFRQNKYLNEYGVLCGAVELTDSSANPIAQALLPLCNGQETNPAIRLLPTTTGYTGSGGTGSYDGTGCILNDGEYMPVTGTPTLFNLDYQIGKGTTVFSGITQNSVYLASNGSSDSSTQDPSLQQTVAIGWSNQGLTGGLTEVKRDVQELRDECKDINEKILKKDLFIQTADKTVGNTTTETSIFDGGLGSLVIPANSLKVGDTVRMRLMGYLSATNGDNATVKVKVGASELVASTSTFPATVTGVFVEFLFDFTIRSIGSSGTVIGQGRTGFQAAVGFGTFTARGLSMTSAVALDTTVNNLIDITYTWGTARVGNTITITNGTVELKRV